MQVGADGQRQTTLLAFDRKVRKVMVKGQKGDDDTDEG